MMPTAAMTPHRISSVTGPGVERAMEAALVARRRPSNVRSRKRPNRPLAWWGFSSLDAIIGDSVSAMMPDTITAPASVKANSRNSAPVRPETKPMGA